MKNCLAIAMSALAHNCFATADVLAFDAVKREPVVKTAQIATATDLHVTKAVPSIERALAPVAETSMKWSWIPATNATTTKNELAILPVPVPGAAALIGLSSLIFARRRQT